MACRPTPRNDKNERYIFGAPDLGGLGRKQEKVTADALSARRGSCTWHESLAILRNVEAAGFKAEDFMPVYEVTHADILGKKRGMERSRHIRYRTLWNPRKPRLAVRQDFQ